MVRIAISQRVCSEHKGSARDCLEQSYARYFEKFGIELVPVPNSLAHLAPHLTSLKVQGIILTGGNDVNPKLYGAKAKPGMNISRERDRTEKELVKFALSRHLPLLAICRGAHFLNVHFGGKLAPVKGHVTPSHKVSLLSSSKLCFSSASAKVNSYHDYGIPNEDLAGTLRPFAMSGDFVEGFYHQKLPMAGMLWHPERKSPDAGLNAGLVRAFVQRKGFWK
ncbi:MAG: gamma-glutamyl-gamma-aminobutyrate hydrolase family protein [Candidatus Micrarchaeia archaeon]|jgi:putative glutamine amidotransferase